MTVFWMHLLKKISDGIKTELEDVNLPKQKRLNENEKKVVG
jgi:hypothetical protein